MSHQKKKYAAAIQISEKSTEVTVTKCCSSFLPTSAEGKQQGHYGAGRGRGVRGSDATVTASLSTLHEIRSKQRKPSRVPG